MLNKKSLLFIVLISLSIGTIAQEIDSLKNDSKPKLGAFIPAAVAVSYGFVALNSNALRHVDNYIHEKINEDHHGFHTSADDYLRYVPAAAVYGLDLMGVKGKNNFRDKTAIFLISSVFSGAAVNFLKRNSNRLRPNKLNDYSFPSGHSATAFGTAEFLSQEYGEESVWYTIGGYGVATTTSVLRLYKNYHWFSDVVAGAGLGILSTKFAYLVYPSIKKALWGKKKSGLVIMPFYQSGGAALAISGRF